MAHKLSDFTVGRCNNFNLIRFLASFLVLYSHSFALTTGTNHGQPWVLSLGMTWGAIAVDIFFVTSGFLVTNSLIRKGSLISFAKARIYRIYPALIGCAIFCVCCVGLYFTTLSVAEYFSDPQTSKFFTRNSTLLSSPKYYLPGVFEQNPYPNAVNGSLWSLPYEIDLYIYLALFGTILITVSKRLIQLDLFKLGLMLAALVTLSISILNHFHPFTDGIFTRLASLFLVGATFYVYREKVLLSHSFFMLILVGLVTASLNADLFFVVYSLVLPYIILYLAYIPRGRIRQYNNFGDYSYGLYLYAFPIQQGVAAVFHELTISLMIGISFGITLIMAFLSWHLIEKRCLRHG